MLNGDDRRELKQLVSDKQKVIKRLDERREQNRVQYRSAKFTRSQIVSFFKLTFQLQPDEEFTVIDQDNYSTLRIVTSTGIEYGLFVNGGYVRNGGSSPNSRD